MVKRVQVLHIIDHMGPGGAQRIIQDLIENTHNEEFLFYSLKNCSFFHNPNNSLKYRDSKFKYDILSIFELRTYIKESNIKILHCHLKKAFFIGYLLKLFFFHDIILIFHVHSKTEGNIFSTFLHVIQDKVDLFIAVSAGTQKGLIKHSAIPEKKIKILYNFVNLEHFNPQNMSKFSKELERTRHGIDHADYVIGFAARIVEVKGWQELLMAFHVLKSENTKLLIAGTGKDEKKLLAMVGKLKLENNVKYIGFIDDMLRFYCCIDYFVMPSHREGLPMAGLEAQACGIPVLASNVEGLNEIIQDMETGILFEKGNVQEIAEKIDFLIEHEDLKRKIIKNSLENAQNYSLTDYVKKLKRIYSEFGNDIQ